MAVIEVKDFRKSFGPKVVHDGVSFYVRKGECLGLVGGSGTGKSVLLRSLIGLEIPNSGSIAINGEEITKFNESQWLRLRKKVAYAFQGGALFDSMTVFQNLSYPLAEHTKMSKEEIKQRIANQLADFGLAGTESLYPNELSGGMQKRVGLARAMMLEPEVLLYDEPTAGLDPYNTKRIQELILNLKTKGVTSILVTHDMPTALAVCDKFAFLKDKVIKEQGTIDQLKNRTDSLIHQFIEGNIL
ncbi:ABC transporter ATP-binding protein [Pseudobdellovibrio exovorus]|uniref:ABC-type organic solvent resistance transport system ATP-binding protein n=1 Tax=Pseudobdellovibrio exovorus JSS TaxID=1184267 RepID=M4VD07_9BACT|nr:ABC transporter ATP-binding protein [Pseudobdellovibrio exovorus]AGH96370.1 ABC-type organic solvent resistance transport system ATP-binding protein [Pseudobdellovibrio exovorus JSS]